MFNLGLPELILIGAAALLVFGPKKLPELAKGLGKGIRDFKKALEGNNDDEASKDGHKPGSTETLPPANAPPNTVAHAPDKTAETVGGKSRPGDPS